MPSSAAFALPRIAVFLSLLAAAGGVRAQPQEFTPPQPPCNVDLRRVGTLRDILSNTLRIEHRLGQDRIRSVLREAMTDVESAAQLLQRVAASCDLDAAALHAAVERHRHVNCDHAGGSGGGAVGQGDTMETDDTSGAVELTSFAANVTAHVVLHELGHALVREFDLPVLANEEALADAFATHYLTTRMPDRALEVLRARIDSLMFEAREVPRDQWTVKGEHGSDARRAYQIAALALAADADAYAPLARAVGMIGEEVRRARDYGAEIHRSWRRILRPLWMPAGEPSSEARLRFDGEGLSSELERSPLACELEVALRAFDWHSQVTLAFVEGEGGAGWARSARTITVHSGYVARFVAQGRAIAAASSAGEPAAAGRNSDQGK